MSQLDEVRSVHDRIMTAAAEGDFAAFAEALDDEVEVFDHVPYLFQGKRAFAGYLQQSGAGAESITYNAHQTSLRMVNDSTAVVNICDRIATVPKGGGTARIQCGRATWVYARRGRDWKIVTAHFSPLPAE